MRRFFGSVVVLAAVASFVSTANAATPADVHIRLGPLAAHFFALRLQIND
jgi:hypothetical protein